MNGCGALVERRHAGQDQIHHVVAAVRKRPAVDRQQSTMGIKWMFVMWIGTIGTLIALAKF